MEKSAIEGKLIVQEMLKSNPEVMAQASLLTQEYLENLIKLFALSCSTGRECRALDIARLTTTPQGIQAMCNYAAKNKRTALSEKVIHVLNV